MRRSSLFRRPLSMAVAAALALAAGPGHADDSSAPATTGAKVYLPDSAALARVDRRRISVFDFRDRYFSSDGETRPAPDSAGRVQFLSTMVDKDVMALAAWEINAPLRFEDRLNLREYESTLLAKTLLTRRLTDSVTVSDEEARAIYPQFGLQLRLRYMLFGDLATAQKVQVDLVRGRTTWKEAARRYSLAPDSLIEGDLGWIPRVEFHWGGAAEVYALQPPGVSKVFLTDDGYRIWQCLDRKPYPQPPYIGVRTLIKSELRSQQTYPRREKLYREVEVRAHVTYDSTNVSWFGEMFRLANPPLPASNTVGSIDLRHRAPTIAPADTGRVLAHVGGGNFTVHAFMSKYSAVPAVARVKIANTAALFEVLRRMVLEPEFVTMAREQGLQKDPEVLVWMNRREEQLRVQRMYDDSVATRISVTEADRRKYYDEHHDEFMSRERVVYATLSRRTEAGADSLIARIAHGESARAIFTADSLSGWTYGGVRSLLQGTPNNFSPILFGELKPGQSTKVGPANDGSWIVLSLISYEPTRQMSYPEVAALVDESVQNIAAEQRFEQVLAGLRRKRSIETHPELVMQVRLSDPAADKLHQ